MLKASDFYNELYLKEIDSFYGVPDSLLKEFCAYISEGEKSKNNIITANEGNAIAMAAGYNLATGKIPLVYMQNSGIGNTINPLISLVDEEVYSIPMLLLIGWRGEPGIKDEPQHVKQGKITLGLLDTLGIEYKILPDNLSELKKILSGAISYTKSESKPFALVVKKNTFEKFVKKDKAQIKFDLSREDALQIMLRKISSQDILVSTTGKLSRELYELRENNNMSHESDFLTVGSMGHASSIASAIAKEKENRNVFCLDGDGAMLMHMGALAGIGTSGNKNFKHILFNNGVHESVGSQQTVGFLIDFPKIIKACGYIKTFTAKSSEELNNIFSEFLKSDGPSFLEVKINSDSRNDLGRPKTTPMENKNEFIRFIRK